MSRARLQTLMAIALVVSLASCSTTYDTGATSTTVATTTTLPSGTTEELLANILQAVTGLGDAIVDNSSDAKDRIAFINANWKIVQEDLGSLTADDTEPMVRLIRLANTAVTRKRPADADKVQKFLPDVIDSILTKL